MVLIWGHLMPRYAITLPVGMNVQDWAYAVNLDLSRVGTVGILANPNEWQKWALGVVQIPELSPLNPPNPMEFSDWREWANRFVNAMY